MSYKTFGNEANKIYCSDSNIELPMCIDGSTQSVKLFKGEKGGKYATSSVYDVLHWNKFTNN